MLFFYSSSAWLGVLITMKFTRYLLLFHFSRADRAVQIWMHFADNVDESKNCLPTWHMGFCKLEREPGGRRQEEGRGSTNHSQFLGHGCRESGTSGRGWAGQGNRNGEKGKNKAQQRGTGGLYVKWAEGVHTGSALGEGSPEGEQKYVCDGKRALCLLWRRGVVSDMGDTRDTAVISGDGSVRNRCTSRGKEGNSPAFDTSLDPGCRTETWSLISFTALPPSCSASSGCDMFVSGAVESSCSWCACLGIFSRYFAL